ncbi:MAG: F0F1 ATP synthase subunit epsilon [Bacteroidetes bacterium]|nr:F0F1 ATP synthase subunit epsilon [Bacteroidota bacterium]
MAEKNFHLDIVTPTKTIYSGEVQSFTAPGVIGSFQVLFNHAPLLSSIGIGEVKLTGSDGKNSHFATSGGFVEVKSNKVILLAESAERSDEINVERAESAKKRAAERLEKRTKEIDAERAQLALARALNRLKVAGKN